jgi:hypothetical protein
MLTPSAIRSASRRISRGNTLAAPSTPFRLRAVQRRAANTPGRDRRKSGRMQRETPFDILRNLGKGTLMSAPASEKDLMVVLLTDNLQIALAPTSRPIQSSPQEQLEKLKRDGLDELDNEPVPERPRLSLPIDDVTEEYEEGSPDIPPPRLSLALDEEDLTQQSVEYPRRLTDELERTRQSRLSENFGDLSRVESVSEGRDNTIVLQQGEEDQVLEDTTITQGAFDAG